MAARMADCYVVGGENDEKGGDKGEKVSKFRQMLAGRSKMSNLTSTPGPCIAVSMPDAEFYKTCSFLANALRQPSYSKNIYICYHIT